MSGFVRAMVAISMTKPVEGIPIVLLEKGALLGCSDGTPPFQLATEVRLGVGCTVFTDAESTDPGPRMVPRGTITSVLGYPPDAVLVAQQEVAGGYFGGQIVGGVEVLDALPSEGTAIQVAKRDPRYAKAELDEARTIVRMNLDYFSVHTQGAILSMLSAFVSGYKEAAIAEVFANFARVGLIGLDRMPVLMGFRDTKLVYLSVNDVTCMSKLASGTSLFLASERTKLLTG